MTRIDFFDVTISRKKHFFEPKEIDFKHGKQFFCCQKNILGMECVEAKSSIDMFDKFFPIRKDYNDKDFWDGIQQEIRSAEQLYEVS